MGVNIPGLLEDEGVSFVPDRMVSGFSMVNDQDDDNDNGRLNLRSNAKEHGNE